MKIEFAYIPGTNCRAVGVVVIVRPHVLNDTVSLKRSASTWDG